MHHLNFNQLLVVTTVEGGFEEYTLIISAHEDICIRTMCLSLNYGEDFWWQDVRDRVSSDTCFISQLFIHMNHWAFDGYWSIKWRSKFLRYACTQCRVHAWVFVVTKEHPHLNCWCQTDCYLVQLHRAKPASLRFSYEPCANVISSEQ